MVLAAGPAQEDVRRLDVAVNEAASMSGVERSRHLADDPLDPRQAGPMMDAQKRPQIGAGNELHREKQHSRPHAGPIYRHEVRVVDSGGELCLRREACDRGGVLGVLGGNDLEGNRPVEGWVRGPVHHSHPTPGDHLLDDVPGKVRPGCEDGRGKRRPVRRHR